MRQAEPNLVRQREGDEQAQRTGPL
jgi:hypothetical protein